MSSFIAKQINKGKRDMEMNDIICIASQILHSLPWDLEGMRRGDNKHIENRISSHSYLFPSFVSSHTLTSLPPFFYFILFGFLYPFLSLPKGLGGRVSVCERGRNEETSSRSFLSLSSSFHVPSLSLPIFLSHIIPLPISSLHCLSHLVFHR